MYGRFHFLTAQGFVKINILCFQIVYMIKCYELTVFCKTAQEIGDLFLIVLYWKESSGSELESICIIWPWYNKSDVAKQRGRRCMKIKISPQVSWLKVYCTVLRLWFRWSTKSLFGKIYLSWIHLPQRELRQTVIMKEVPQTDEMSVDIGCSNPYILGSHKP